MQFKTKALFILTILMTQLYPIAHSHAEPSPITTNSTHDYRAVSFPEKDRLTLISIYEVSVGRETLGAIAAYDDIATPRAADYLELYNNAGALLAVSWFDRFGIERLAVDRALAEDTSELEGVFVLVITDDSI